VIAQNHVQTTTASVVAVVSVVDEVKSECFFFLFLKNSFDLFRWRQRW